MIFLSWKGIKRGAVIPALREPDIDVDYASDRRQEMKEYLEERYNINGKQRVFSAGTFTTLKLKAILKDVARVHRVPHAIVNYITAIFEDDKMDWTDLFKVAADKQKGKQVHPRLSYGH